MKIERSPLLSEANEVTLRTYEAWTVEPCDGGREVTDECGCDHGTLAEAREAHRHHPWFNVIVAIDIDENGMLEVAKEYRHAPRPPKSFFDKLVWDMVKR